MDLGFGEDHDLLRATTRRFLTEHQPLAGMRLRMEEENLFDATLWRRGAQLGWTAMLIPAEYDGGSITEQPLVDLIALAEEIGRELNPGPLVPCSVVADAIVRFGTDAQRKEQLPQLARGEMTAAWCLSSDGTPEPSSVGVNAVKDGDEWHLDGLSDFVQGADDASLFLVTATYGDGFLNFLVPSSLDGLSMRVHAGLDLSRRYAQARFDDVKVSATAQLSGGWEIVERGLALATVVHAAESVGAADRLFDSTVEYSKNRVQFKRPIGSFQALKHRMADMLVAVEGMRAATYYAALALEERLDDAPEAVATVGAYVFDAFSHFCGEALQLHGGIGFTWEHDVHLFVRRAKVNQVMYGDSAWHRDRLVRLLERTAPTEGG